MKDEGILRIEALWRETIHAGKAVVAQAVQQVDDVRHKDRFGDFQSAAAPAKWKWRQKPNAGRMSQLVGEQIKVVAHPQRQDKRRITRQTCNHVPSQFIIIEKLSFARSQFRVKWKAI